MSTRGQGSVWRPKYRARDGTMKESAVWWICYYQGRKRVRESSRTTVKREAVKILTKKLAQGGRAIPRRKLEKVRFSDLCQLIRTDYRKHGRKSVGRMELAIRHLESRFAGWRAADIETADIDKYAVDRLNDGAARATVNRELACLRRMFKLAKRARMAGDLPEFDLLEEANARKGFWTPDELGAVLAELPVHLHPLVLAGYMSGWRRGELLSRRWRHVDLDGGWLRMDPHETKDDAGRELPLIPELRDLLAAQHRRKLEVEKRTGQLIQAVFFYPDGRPIQDPKRAWNGARIRAGLWVWAEDENGNPVYLKSGKRKRTYTRTFHDFRRTAARNLIRSGLARSQAKGFTGHITDSVFDRYAIDDAASKKEAAEKYAAHMETQRPTQKVINLR